ncbi:MAG: metal ABC transporter ATP-binding protein [Candidatus Nitrosocaldus sp.]
MNRDDDCDTAEIAVSIKDITYGYTSIPVLERIDLNVRKGEVIGLLGPNGSGKSTLLKIIAGLIRPSSGSIDFGNRRRGRSNKPVIGYMPQVESIDWDFPITVEEVVALGLWNRSGVMPWSSRYVRERVHKVLEDLGMSSKVKRQIRELSGGEQKRVFLARAIVHGPELMLLDEPTTGADPSTRDDILRILYELSREEGVTIILSTHDIRGVALNLPRVVCLNKRILADGDAKDILTQDNLLRIYGLIDSMSVV